MTTTQRIVSGNIGHRGPNSADLLMITYLLCSVGATLSQLFLLEGDWEFRRPSLAPTLLEEGSTRHCFGQEEIGEEMLTDG